MPSALGPALAVAALLPLATARPRFDHVSRADRAAAANALVSCIEDDTTLMDKINECLQDEGSFEENITYRSHISFGILDEHWDKLHLLQQAVFPGDLLLKVKLIKAFRALMASIYRSRLARLVSTVDRDKADSDSGAKVDVNSDKNEIKKSIEHPAEGTDTTTESPTLPTSTGETSSEDDDVSNDIAYEGAGSDPKISVIHPPLEDDNIGVTPNTDRPYRVLSTLSEKNSYEGEGNDTASTLYEREVTLSGIDILTKNDLADGDFHNSRAYDVSSSTKSSLQITESYELKGESPSSINNITPVDFKINTRFVERNEGGGTDIDENEMFPRIEITKKTESEENTSSDRAETTPNTNAGVEIHIDHASTAEFDAGNTENSSSQNEKSMINHGKATQNIDEENSQTTEQSLDDLSKQHASKSITTSDSVHATPSYDLGLEGKENDNGVTSGQEISSVHSIYPTTLPVDSRFVSISLTNSDPDGNESNTVSIEIDERKYEHGVSSDSVPPDSYKDPVDNSEEEIVLNNETSSAYPNSNVPDLNTPTEIEADTLNINASGENDTGNNHSVISKMDSTSEKQLTDSLSLPTEIFDDGEKVMFEQTSTMPPAPKVLPYETESYSNSDYYNPTTNGIDDVKHVYSTATSSVHNHIPTITRPSTDYGRDGNNNYHADTSTLSYFITEVTESPRDSKDLEKSENPIEATSAQYADENKYGTSGLLDTTKSIKIPIDIDVSPQEPETNEEFEQRPSIVVSDAVEVTTSALHPESGDELDENPTDHDDRKQKHTSTYPAIVVSPSSQINVVDGVSSDSGSGSYQKPSTLFLDDDRSDAKGIDGLEEATDGDIPTINVSDTTKGIGRGNRTESKNNYHTFSIPLPEVQQAKKGNTIVNTLRIFPPGNGHTLMTQLSYKRGCLSQNDCVRVWSSYNAKQRRTPTVNNLELGGEDLQRFPTGDADSVVWWNKMKALKKKSR